jgi:outer membrane protein OmpA-like peptidoglycan-associated protein
LVSSGEFGMQQHALEVPADSAVLNVVNAVLNPGEGGRADLTVAVVDPEGRPARGIEIMLDGSPVGALASGGSVTLQALATGRRTVGVRGGPYEATSQRLNLRNGPQSTTLRLAWAPGATRVTATSAEGVVTDAMVRIAGPAAVRPLPVNAAGQAVFALQPGEWQALVSSPTYGMRQAVISIPEGTKGLTDVKVMLAKPEADKASLLVRVQDPDGTPIPGAAVKLDGADAEVAPAGGAVLYSSLEPGSVRIAVSAPGYKPGRIDGASLDSGSNERIVVLAFELGKVVVSVADTDGNAVDAKVRFQGPADVTPRSIGADGTDTFEVRPGFWRVLASTVELGMGRSEVTVGVGGEPQSLDLVLSPTRMDVSGGAIKILEQVHFEVDKAAVTKASNSVLDEVANTLVGRPDVIRVEIQGHTDSTGGVAYNLELSQGRAEAVRAALIERGVAPERLLARGYGPTRPIQDNGTADGRAANRRVQFEIIEAAE